MSTVTMSSAVTTFDPDHYMHPLRQVIHHPAVLLFFESILKNDAVFQDILDKNIVSGIVGGKRIFKPSYPLGCAGWTVVQTLSDIVLAAVHNVTPYPGKGQRSMVIPESAFEELGISSQRDLDLARFHCLPNFLLNLYCNTPDEVRCAFKKFQQFLCRCITWLASRVNHSISKGFDTRLNWGAFIGLRWDEFLFRVSPSTIIAEARRRGVTVDELTMHYYTDDGGALTRYISPSVRYFPDIAAWLHFPYDPRYSGMDFLNSLPRLLTDFSQEDEISSTVGSPPSSSLSSPTTLINDDDFKYDLKDKDMIEDITYLMGNLSLTN